MATTVNIDKNNKTSSTNPHLPKDILINILCTLPTKTILECKQVCKEWRNIILDPRFAEAHYNNATTTSRLSLFGYSNSFYSPNFIYFIESYNHQHNYKMVSFKSIYDSIYVVNSCRGFLLIRPNSSHDYYVYNPLTNERFDVPSLMMVNRLGYLIINMLGLGLGPVTKKYKVVMLVNHDGVLEFRVHTVGADQLWRRLETNKVVSDLHDNYFGVWGSSLDLNGVLHWLVMLDTNPTHVDQVKVHEKIACFDVDKEELSAMASPCSKDHSRKKIVSIGNVNGLFCLGIQESGKPRDQTEFWVMREYGVKESWAVYVVLKHDIVRIGHLNLIEVRDNGEIVCLSNYKPIDLFLYKQREERFIRLRISVFDETLDVKAAIYVPSFFSIHDKGQQQLMATKQIPSKLSTR